MNSNKVKISVIIPVYNCQSYIKQCLESVVNQTIKEIEIICVDDGSEDGSVSIIKECARKDDRIIILQQENQGAGVARNKALQRARGKYVAFLDADDYYLDADALNKMVEQCEQNDVYACGSLSLKEENGERFRLSFWGEDKNLIKAKKYNYNDFQMDYGYYTFIYNRDFLLSNKVFFPNFRRFQDPPFMVKSLYKAKQFAMADTYLYCYRVPNMVIRYNTEKVIDMLNGIIDNLDYAYNNNLNLLFDRTINRLEFEFHDIILHNLKEKSVGILEKLLEANDIVRRHYKDNSYVLRPLQRILGATIRENDNYEIYLRKLLHEKEKIIVYGAGKFGTAFLRYLKEKGQIQKVEYVMVTIPVEPDKFLENIPVISIKDAGNLKLFSHFVLIATGGLFQKEIIQTLLDNGYTEFEALDNMFLSEL